jgi:excisionase family DNA binding protein
MSDSIIRLSVSEAAKLFGISTQTIRRAIADGSLHYVVVQNRYKISFESMVKWSQGSARIKNSSNTKGIGQFVTQWRVKNKKFSPNPAVFDGNSKGQKPNPKTNETGLDKKSV